MRPRFSNTVPEYYPLGGGLDLLTPAISMPPGKVISCQNYEPQIGGGYRRVAGYQRFSGKTGPSASDYYLMGITLTGSIANGVTVTGLTSAATGVSLGIYGTNLILGRVTGTFVTGEALQVAAVTQATSTSAAVVRGASSSSDDADYKALAAADQRALIAAVPGSGRIRGIWYYNAIWYAFRDNAGATAGDMYKSSSTGWVQVTFGSEIQFTTAVGEIFAGNTVTGLTSGATALVVKPMLRSGTWTVAGVGTLIISTITGVWQSGEAIQVAGVTKATSSSLATAITRAVGGQMEFFNANFTGSTATKKMYGVDGVNKAFEFDGTNYIPIRTGMVTDTPTHIVVHRNYLFLSFLGSVQNSGVGAPYSWTAVLGSAEIATGEYVTGFSVQSGSASTFAISTATLGIFTEGKTFVLYGSSTANFQLTPSIDDIGAFPFTMQSVGNDTMLLSNRGVQRLKTTMNFGNFEYASISHLVQSFLTSKRGLQTTSMVSKTRNQYRVFFSDNTALAVGLTGDKISGIMPLDYGIPVRCTCTAEIADGSEVTMFGSDNGYIYQDNAGTSFDGAVITSFIRLPFNNQKSPRTRKRYRAAILELVAEGYAQIQVTYELGYGTLDVASGIAAVDQQFIAAGAFWDAFTWDQFTWDTQAVANPRISLDGIEKNISMLFYSSRAQDDAFTLQGITLVTTPTRLER